MNTRISAYIFLSNERSHLRWRTCYLILPTPRAPASSESHRVETWAAMGALDSFLC